MNCSFCRSSKIYLFLLMVFMSAVARLGFSQSYSPQNMWSGGVQCTVNDQDQTYSRQETQTWTLTGAPKVNDNMQVYSATWTVKGTGQLLRPQGAQTTNITWQSDAQGQASIAFIIRASDGRLMIMTRH